MQLTITIDMDNAAFDGSPDLEVEYILTAMMMPDNFPASPEPGDGGTLRDSNGNTVGEWNIHE